MRSATQWILKAHHSSLLPVLLCFLQRGWDGCISEFSPPPGAAPPLICLTATTSAPHGTQALWETGDVHRKAAPTAASRHSRATSLSHDACLSKAPSALRSHHLVRPHWAAREGPCAEDPTFPQVGCTAPLILGTVLAEGSMPQISRKQLCEPDAWPPVPTGGVVPAH